MPLHRNTIYFYMSDEQHAVSLLTHTGLTACLILFFIGFFGVGALSYVYILCLSYKVKNAFIFHSWLI